MAGLSQAEVDYLELLNAIRGGCYVEESDVEETLAAVGKDLDDLRRNLAPLSIETAQRAGVVVWQAPLAAIQGAGVHQRIRTDAAQIQIVTNKGR